jgi:hypothetical protein
MNDIGAKQFSSDDGIAFSTGIGMSITKEIADADTTNHFATNSSTYTSKHALDVNLLGVLDAPFSTPGYIDIKGADGNVFVRQTTGANLHVNVDSAPTTPVQAAGYGSSPLTVQVSITARPRRSHRTPRMRFACCVDDEHDHGLRGRVGRNHVDGLPAQSWRLLVLAGQQLEPAVLHRVNNGAGIAWTAL